jgi:BlaI family transcriptional regulator, penicillinase repressor
MSAREYLSKREQQIMELVYRQGAMTAVEIQSSLPDKLANSGVRTLLTILERKGWLVHEEVGAKYVYHPAKPREEAARSALQGLVQTFYNGSLGGLVVTLLNDREVDLSPTDIEEIKGLISKAEAEK